MAGHQGQGAIIVTDDTPGVGLTIDAAIDIGGADAAYSLCCARWRLISAEGAMLRWVKSIPAFQLSRDWTRSTPRPETQVGV